MRVFMLGWEFPPYISGGLGTACYGLTKALNQRGHEVTFVLPQAIGTDYKAHVKLLTPQAEADSGEPTADQISSTFQFTPETAGDDPEAFDKVRFKAVPSKVASPYVAAGQLIRHGNRRRLKHGQQSDSVLDAPISFTDPGPSAAYTGDVVTEARRYAGFAVRIAEDLIRNEGPEAIDVIHAHDWMTFPAGKAVSQATGKPFVAHVHSTEHDRAGEFIYEPIAEIEREACQAAARVVTVSRLTRSLLHHRYGVNPGKVDVAYNGINPSNGTGKKSLPPRNGSKTVLFLGRVTHQKGPAYFVAAAKRVLEKLPDTRFVVAGSGDQVHEIIEMAAREGIGHRVFFTGFLRGSEVDRAFRMADVYVMPSVSEPFGISALEAIQNDVPVIVSKQSGVCEVIKNALKVDFWDTHEIAEKIIAVLSRPPLADTLRAGADLDLQQLTWDQTAHRCEASYETAIAASG